MRWNFEGQVIEWRGPAPFLFVPTPEDVSAEIRSLAATLSYGWGCIPVSAEIGGVPFTTSLFPRHGGYLLPVKVAVQRSCGIGVGDWVEVEMAVAG